VDRYVNRDIEKTLKKSIRQFPAFILTGPRQSGKTTLLKHLFSGTHKYASLDDPDIRLLAIDDPKLFLRNYPPPIIIDEIQYAPELLSVIKIVIDENRTKRGLFLLTGSQNFALMAKVTESLAGRIAVFNLLSFSFREKMFLKERPQKSLFDINKKAKVKLDLDDLKKSILTGGFPEVVVDKSKDIELWYSSYIQTYLERDVRQLRQVGDLYDFQRFLYLLASFNGQILKLSNISRDLGVSVNTVKAWIGVLEASNQIALIKPFYLNKGKRIVKSPKIYFLDTGLICYLNGITSIGQVFKGPPSGSLFESVILGEIIRYYYNQGKISQCFWWRTSHGEEVDFIVEDAGKIIPVEVKLTAKIRKEMAKDLLSFIKLFSERVERSFLVNLSDKAIRLDERVKAVPFNEFLS
jgi:predicted AAA+ superfamily ATPase